MTWKPVINGMYKEATAGASALYGPFELGAVTWTFLCNNARTTDGVNFYRNGGGLCSVMATNALGEVDLWQGVPIDPNEMEPIAVGDPWNLTDNGMTSQWSVTYDGVSYKYNLIVGSGDVRAQSLQSETGIFVWGNNDPHSSGITGWRMFWDEGSGKLLFQQFKDGAYVTKGSFGSFQIESEFTAPPVDSPINPDSGYFRLYFKSDGKLYSLDSNGTESQIGGSTDGFQFRGAVGDFPGDPAEGDIVRRTDDHHMYFYNGAAWRQLDIGI